MPVEQKATHPPRRLATGLREGHEAWRRLGWGGEKFEIGGRG
jgi:hypothetical protein